MVDQMFEIRQMNRVVGSLPLKNKKRQLLCSGQQKWLQFTTVVSLSRLSLRPDVLMIIISLQFPSRKTEFMSCLEMTLRCLVHVSMHTDTHKQKCALVAWMDRIRKLADRQQVTAPGPAAPAPPLLSWPSSEQPLNSLLPRHNTGGKQSAPEVHRSHTRWHGRWIEPLY